MKKTLVLSLVAALALVSVSCSQTPQPRAALKVGWQPPWANQGQLVEVLKHTDLLAKKGIEVDFRPFTYGGPMTEAALAGEVDFLLVGNQPAITLLGRDSSFRIVARLPNYRSAIIVPRDSPLKTVADLRGGIRLATAFGSTTHRDTVRRLRDQGVDLEKGVSLVNLDQAEHASLVARGGGSQWGDIAAVATYDPTVAVSIANGHARILEEWPSPAVVVVRGAVLQNRPDDVSGFLAALIEAHAVYATRPSEFNKLYEVDSRLPLTDEVYKSMASFEPNLSMTTPTLVDLGFNEETLLSYEKDVETALSLGILKKTVPIRSLVDQDMINRAKATLKR